MRAFLMVASTYPLKKITVLTPYETRSQINKDSFMIGIWKLKTKK